MTNEKKKVNKRFLLWKKHLFEMIRSFILYK
ncbi:hypothetical protein A943_15680 [Bacillus sp. CPSM8]|nr:hypothetical protein A943_15680 [Bacillus sp. CPSM8]KFM84761.1 hypothetical protein DJ88_320 [Bacillus paralicheniformis]